MRDVICGVDPGVAGALCIFRDGSPIYIADMPTVTVRINGTNRQRVNAQLLSGLLGEWRIGMACVEAQRPRHTDGPAQGFYLGNAAGIVEGVLAAKGIPITFVDPQIWRSAMGVRLQRGSKYADRKEASRKRALELWPEHEDWFQRKRDSDRAESCLIAKWMAERAA